MKLLIDTHAVIWYVDQDHLLSPLAHSAITDPANDIVLSAATIWEIAIKVGLGKLTLSQPYRLWMNQALADLGAPSYRSRSSTPMPRPPCPLITATRSTAC